MIRPILTTALACLVAAGAFAETAVLDYTYAGGELFSYGKGRAETVDVAMRIADPAMAGLRLTGLKAYISTTDAVSDASVWLSRNLRIENKANVPDIASYKVTPLPVSEAGRAMGLLEIEFPEPFVLTEEPLYMGYTVTVGAIETQAQQNPVVLSRGTNPDGFFVHMSKSVLKWLDSSEEAGGVAYIVASLEGDYPANSLAFAASENAYAMGGEPFKAEFLVANRAVNPISSVKYLYSFDDLSDIREGFVELPSPVYPALYGSAPVLLRFEGLSGVGAHELHVTVTEVNGRENESESPSITAPVTVIPFKPQHRPLVEEYTGLWCGWCPGGYIGMEMIAEEYGDGQVSICYHDNDALSVTSDFAMPVSDFPVSSIDRVALIDPYYGTDPTLHFGIGSDLEEAMEVLAPAEVEVEAVIEGNVVKAFSKARFVRDFEDAGYEMGYVLTCSGLFNPSWAQENYYAGRTGYEGTPLEVLTTWPALVRGLVFNDVAVDVAGMKGVPGSLPPVIETGREYTGEFSFDISGNSLVQDRANLAVVAFVRDKSTGVIINSARYSFASDAVGSVSDETRVVARDCYDLLGRKTGSRSKGVSIVVETLSDGSTRVCKERR